MANFTPQQIEDFLQEFFDTVGARQYIGARYVPIFGRAGSDTVEWDDLAPYEPLTVVMHEGVSYVSRRYVPRGIQITDTAYWVETYRFNAQVEQYRQEVLSFDSRIEAVRDECVPFPDPDTYPKYGTEGQVLSTLADGTTRWDDPVTVDADVAEPLIDAWLDDHPEATTSVEDGSITYPKFHQTVIDGLTRIARPSNVLTLNQDSTNNTVTTTLVENAYVILDATVTNPGRYTAAGLYLGTADDFKNKNVTVVVEVAEQTGMAGSSVIAYVTKQNSWGPADKIELWNKANWQQSETVMKRSLTPSDLLTFADSDQFWVMVNVQDQPAACSYRLRAYVVVNDAASVEKPQSAYTADVAVVANAVGNGSVHWASLDQQLNDGLTRIARPTTVSTLNQDSTNNTVTTTLVENAYAILDATVTNPGRYTAAGLYLGTADDFKNKNVTVVVEVAEQTGMDGSSVIAYVTKQNSWGPADKIELWNKANWQQSETVMKRSLTPSDLLTFADSDQFWVMVNVQDQPAACSYRLRAYVVVNDAPHVDPLVPGSVHWETLDQQLNDGLTRIARPTTVSTLNQDSENNTVTATLVENAYAILDATVANPGRYTALCLKLGKAKDFKNKNVTVVVEVAEQTGMDGSNVNVYITKTTSWGPADKIELWKVSGWRQSKTVMKRSVTPSDLLAFADSDDFWVLVDVEGQQGACSYRLRAYAVVNDAAYLGPDAYDTDLLFWGDSLTAGAGGGGTNYPSVCAYALGLDHINAGVGGENSNTIAARQGGNNLIIPPGTVNGTYSLAQFVDVYGARIAPLRQGSGSGTGSHVYVNGNKANLAINQASATDPDATYTISGYYGGNINREMPAYFEGAKVRGRIVVIWVGQNGSYIGGTDSVNARISIIDGMISHIGHDRYVVLGMSTGTDSSRADDDAAMLAHYGNKFLPTRHMLVGYGLTMEGITPTSQDQTDIAAGTVPTSLRSDGTHLNASGYDALGKIVADKVRSLGYV